MNTQASYDRVASEYVRRIADELQHKAVGRKLLDRFAASVRNVHLACDMGRGRIPVAGGRIKIPSRIPSVGAKGHRETKNDEQFTFHEPVLS
jgi:hypothetical protein